MLSHRNNWTSETLSFWQEAAKRLNLSAIEEPVTAETLDRMLEELREVSHEKVDQDYPFVPPMIRLFAIHDDDFYQLLEAFGEQTLDRDVQQAVTDLMKELPGLWAMAAEIKMTRNRLGWMASAEEVRYRLNRSL